MEQANITEACSPGSSQGSKSGSAGHGYGQCKQQWKCTECGTQTRQTLMKQLTFDWSATDKHVELRTSNGGKNCISKP